MTTKMKGLLKGLRYISQIFDAKDDEEEEEMQIGFPTDVKHVAHIGWDGPSVTSPSWMNDFKPGADGSSNPSTSKGDVKEKSSSSRDIGSSGSGGGSLASEQIPPKPSRRRPSAGASSFDASTQDPPVDVPHIPKQSSRRQKPPGLTISSPARDASSADGATKPTRRHHSQNHNSIESPKADSPSGQNKQSRRKKTKGSSSGGGSSGGSSKSRAKSSSTATSTELVPSDINNNNNGPPYNCPSSEMKSLDLEEKGYDRINF